MTSKRDRKCMANESIDTRVALRLNSWQSGALGKLRGSVWPEWDTKRYWLTDTQSTEPLVPVCREAQGCVPEQSTFYCDSLSLFEANECQEQGYQWSINVVIVDWLNPLRSAIAYSFHRLSYRQWHEENKVSRWNSQLGTFIVHLYKFQVLLQKTAFCLLHVLRPLCTG